MLCREHGQKVGIVVDKKPCNEGLTKSVHTRHILNTYQNVYYVFFSGEGRWGPFHATDLTLQQSCQTTDSSMVL